MSVFAVFEKVTNDTDAVISTRDGWMVGGQIYMRPNRAASESSVIADSPKGQGRPKGRLLFLCALWRQKTVIVVTPATVVTPERSNGSNDSLGHLPTGVLARAPVLGRFLAPLVVPGFLARISRPEYFTPE